MLAKNEVSGPDVPKAWSLSITDAAAARILEVVGRQNGAASALRVAVVSGGCSGFSYRFELASEPEPHDEVFGSVQGARVIVDPLSIALMDGAELDYLDNLMDSRFTVRNPMAAAGCGCGTSFSVP